MEIRFRFRSSLQFEAVDIGDQSSISIRELKLKIVFMKRLNSCHDFDLLFFDDVSGLEFTDENTRIPAGSSVIVKRVPAQSPQFWELDVPAGNVGSENVLENIIEPLILDFGIIENDDFGVDFRPPPVPSVIINQKIPSNLKEKKDSLARRSSAKGPVWGDTRGATLATHSNRKDVDANEQCALAMHSKPIAKKQTEVASAGAVTNTACYMPIELNCSLCASFFKEAVMIPCCQHSFCEKCIRLALIQNSRCPMCSSNRCKPEDLLPNLSLRQTVERFLNSLPLDYDLENDLDRYAPDSESGIQEREMSCAVAVQPKNFQLNRCETKASAMSLAKPNGDHVPLDNRSEFQGESNPLIIVGTEEGGQRNFVTPGRANKFQGFRTCFHCGSPDHMVKECPSASSAQTGNSCGPGNVPFQVVCSAPSQGPRNAPSKGPGNAPSKGPGNAPSKSPGNAPSKSPGNAPFKGPGNAPSKSPGNAPSKGPGNAPSKGPGNAPSKSPGNAPSKSPGNAPSKSPGNAPSKSPGNAPSKGPGNAPSKGPGNAPFQGPGNVPFQGVRNVRSQVVAPGYVPTPQHWPGNNLPHGRPPYEMYRGPEMMLYNNNMAAPAYTPAPAPAPFGMSPFPPSMYGGYPVSSGLNLGNMASNSVINVRTRPPVLMGSAKQPGSLNDTFERREVLNRDHNVNKWLDNSERGPIHSGDSSTWRSDKNYRSRDRSDDDDRYSTDDDRYSTRRRHEKKPRSSEVERHAQLERSTSEKARYETSSRYSRRDDDVRERRERDHKRRTEHDRRSDRERYGYSHSGSDLERSHSYGDRRSRWHESGHRSRHSTKYSEPNGKDIYHERGRICKNYHDDDDDDDDYGKD